MPEDKTHERLEGRIDSLHIKFDAVIKELGDWRNVNIERLTRLEERTSQNKIDIDYLHEARRKAPEKWYMLACAGCAIGTMFLSFFQR